MLLMIKLIFFFFKIDHHKVQTENKKQETQYFVPALDICHSFGVDRMR